jgi:hypothetical protein
LKNKLKDQMLDDNDDINEILKQIKEKVDADQLNKQKISKVACAADDADNMLEKFTNELDKLDEDEKAQRLKDLAKVLDNLSKGA